MDCGGLTLGGVGVRWGEAKSEGFVPDLVVITVLPTSVRHRLFLAHAPPGAVPTARKGRAAGASGAAVGAMVVFSHP